LWKKKMGERKKKKKKKKKWRNFFELSTPQTFRAKKTYFQKIDLTQRYATPREKSASRLFVVRNKGNDGRPVFRGFSTWRFLSLFSKPKKALRIWQFLNVLKKLSRHLLYQKLGLTSNKLQRDNEFNKYVKPSLNNIVLKKLTQNNVFILTYVKLDS